MTVYEQLIEAANDGKSVVVDFYNRTAKINGINIKGCYGVTKDNAKQNVERLFNQYCYSYPSTRGVKKKSYFNACSFEELTEKQLATGKDRVVAQVELEGYILGLILCGCPFSAFDNDNKHWFWQSPKNKRLIVMKDWFKE